MYKNTLHTILLFCLFYNIGLSQCKDPFVPTFSERTPTSIKIGWLDNNVSPMGYQLAHGEKGIHLNNATKSEILNIKSKTLNDLSAGTSYNFWLRTICDAADTSNWVGPYAFTTYMTNPSPCEMKIEIKDNSCNNNSGDQFFILVDIGNNSSAQNLESVSLIIQHTWPADLKIDLESPWGEVITLSQFNGTVSDNFGALNMDCSNPTIFSDEACTAVKNSKPPFIGNFIPDEPLSNLHNSNSKNGLWKLRICDDAFNDKGILRYVKLNFAPFACAYVDDFYVSRVNSTSYQIQWKKPDHCVNMEINYRKKGNPIFDRKKIVNCDSLNVLITGLEPDSEYEFTMTSNCGGTMISSPSCISSLKTLCKASTLYENFDGQQVCEPSCIVPCNIASFLFNSISDQTDWIVYKDETPTEFTGPSGGAFGGGNYIYIESNTNVCDSFTYSVLETKCLKTSEANSTCDLSFFYHMFGSDVGTLKIEKTDNDKDWEVLKIFEGSIKNEWLQERISIEEEANRYYRLRFTGTTKNGIQGDIALDEISLTNGVEVTEITYYLDQDGDGYGDEDSILVTCSTTVPLNFTLLKGDCNDKNPEVNPFKEDVPCNLVDENCDGIIELEDLLNPIIVDQVTITNVSCAGKSDAKIAIDISGGTPPYQYFWNNNEVIEDIENIDEGFYFARITDANGCGLVTDTFNVIVLSEYQINVSSVSNPTCFGKANGGITIEHNSGFPPFNYLWSNGATTKDLIDIADGLYQLSVTDAVGCIEISDSIKISSNESYSALTSFKKNPLCFGQATGILEVQGIGGIGPYQFQWATGQQNNRILNLAHGVYTVTIEDNVGCKVIYSDEIKQPEILDIKLLNVEPARCNASKTGIIKTITTGGTLPYAYQWNDSGPPLETRNNLNAGLYRVTVSDINGCSDMINAILLFQPPPIVYEIDSVVFSSCLAKDDGKIFTTINGGIKPYAHYWNGTNQFTEDVDSLLPGNYTLTILDAHNCKLTTDAIEVLNYNVAKPIMLSVLEENKCPMENNASIRSEITSGALPLDYNWDNGVQKLKYSLVDTLSNLSSGSYQLTITDNQGCVSISNSIKIDAISNFNPFVNITQNICQNDSLGEISVNTSGATPPYKYIWSNGETDDFIDGLKNGDYAFTITDKNDCVFESQNINLTSLSKLSCTLTKTNAEAGKMNGSCTVIPQGGIGNYSIIWNGGTLSGFNVQNLEAGVYPFTLFDNLNCRLDSFVVIDLINIITEIDQLHIKVYPNPTSDVLIIENYLQKKIEVDLYSINGIKLKSELIDQKINTFYVNEMAEGIYYLKLSDDKRTTIYKIFIVK